MINKTCLYCAETIGNAHHSRKYHKTCLKEKEKKRVLRYYYKNKRWLLKKGKEYGLKNKQKLKEYRKKYGENNKEKIKNHKQNWRRENREETRKYRKKWRKENPEYNRKYYQKNKEKILKQQKEHYQKNRKIILKKQKKYKRRRRKIDKNFNIICRLRQSLIKALKHYTKTGKIMNSKQYGIDYKAIIKYLKPFPKNLKDYEMHHIKPLHTFNFVNKDGSTNLKEVRKAFAPKNHKWLTIKEHKEIHKKLK